MHIQTVSPYTRPAKGTTTERVWEIADELSRRTGKKAKRKNVIEKYVAEGGNPNTASTQYYYWSQKFGEKDVRQDTLPLRRRIGPMQLRVEPNGRLFIPAELREAMELGGEGKVTALIADGELRVISPQAALRRLRKKAKELVPDGSSVVDEFISEKRKEAERE